MSFWIDSFMAAILKRRSVSFFIVGALVTGGCNSAPTTPPRATLNFTTTQIRYKDISLQSGIDYRWSITGPRPLNILQTIGNGCAFLDYNNDGNLDILLIGPKLALYKGDGHGHFVNVTHATGLDKFSGHFLGCAVGDYDSDGYDDLYISGYHTGLLLHNDHGHGFTDVTREAGLKPQPWGTSCSFVETQPGSGRLDLIVQNYVHYSEDPKESPKLCEQEGVLTACGPRTYPSAPLAFYKNEGGGHFSDLSAMLPPSGKGLGIACAPLGASRQPVIALANDEAAGGLLRTSSQNGHIAFSDIAVQAGTAYDQSGSVHAGMGTDWGDYDNDGELDLFTTTYQGEAKSLYHNDGREFFHDTSAQMGLGSATVPHLSFGTKFVDITNDGWLDLVITNGHVEDNIQQINRSAAYRQPTQILENELGQSYSDVSASTGADIQKPIVGRGLAVGDFDNDGSEDLLVVDSEGTPLLLHNETTAPGNWLELNLIGSKSNRDGYGAIVTAETPGLTQSRLCHADGSYLSSSEKRVHIGLGAAKRVQLLQVHWPSGQIDTFEDVTVNKIITIHEGKSGINTVTSHSHP